MCAKPTSCEADDLPDIGGRHVAASERIDPSGRIASSAACQFALHEHKMRQPCVVGIAHDGMGRLNMRRRTAAIRVSNAPMATPGLRRISTPIPKALHGA